MGTLDRPGEDRKPKAKPDAKLRAVPEAAMGSVRETLKEQGLPAGGNVTFVQARTAHEIAKAHLARLRLQRTKGGTGRSSRARPRWCFGWRARSATPG